MVTGSANLQSQHRIEHPALDWEEVEQGMRRARELRSEAFTQAMRAPWLWISEGIERARAPIDFEPIGT